MPRVFKGRISEQLIDSNNHSAQDAIVVGDGVKRVAIRCTQASTNNVNIGWNEPATEKNQLQPGESVSYGDDELYLQGNKLYIGFTGSDTQALISFLIDVSENC